MHLGISYFDQSLKKPIVQEVLYLTNPLFHSLHIQAFIVPIFGSGVFIPYYAGIAFGYKF